MSIKTSAEDVGWNLREAAWELEERLIWRGSDAARPAVDRALRAVEPLQRLVQTRLAWPLSDAMRERRVAAQGALATAAVVVVAGASAGGALLSTPERPERAATDPAVAIDAPAAIEAAAKPQLSGVAVDFETASAATPKETTVAAQATAPPAAVPQEAAPPSQVAMQFAEAFVAYEVGEVNEQTAATFAAVADAPLAQALGGEPPRLPAGQKVPKARVLNVVVGERKGKLLEASVSLVRLQAASELRLTLRDTPKGWRVAKVLG